MTLCEQARHAFSRLAWGALNALAMDFPPNAKLVSARLTFTVEDRHRPGAVPGAVERTIREVEWEEYS